MSYSDELALITKIQQGDKQALGKLWDIFTPKLFGYLVNTLKDRALAEDLLQSTWLNAIKALPRFEPRGMSVGGWLFAIAKNECRQHWRKDNREVPLDLTVHDTAQNKSNELVTKLAVEKILATLSTDDQEILRLRYIADLPTTDIAKLLNLNFATVRVRIHRAISRARKSLITQNL